MILQILEIINKIATVVPMSLTVSAMVWEYILNLSKEEYSEKMILQILEIINKIATVVPMSLTVSTMVRGFQQSVLFGSVLPGFINEVTERPSHVRYFF